MLTIESVLPVRWHHIDATDAAALARRFDVRNERLLRVLQVVETSGAADHGDDAGVGGELHRIEAKLDMMIELLGELIVRDQPAPASVPARFNAESLELLLDSAPPVVGDDVVVEIVINPRLPRALQFVTRTDASTPEPHGIRVTLRLTDISPQVREQLERQVFLLHRRSLSRGGTATTRI